MAIYRLPCNTNKRHCISCWIHFRPNKGWQDTERSIR
uniref:Uncharacterized protein n=1 Tax=Anguilla anguilla TaxID=7936 RepID=A0A0E9QRQ3_ANGAN